MPLECGAADMAAARTALSRGDVRAAAGRFGNALARWRGPMLAGLRRGAVLAPRCASVEDDRLLVVEELADAHLRLDEPDNERRRCGPDCGTSSGLAV